MKGSSLLAEHLRVHLLVLLLLLLLLLLQERQLLLNSGVTAAQLQGLCQVLAGRLEVRHETPSLATPEVRLRRVRVVVEGLRAVLRRVLVLLELESRGRNIEVAAESSLVPLLLVLRVIQVVQVLEVSQRLHKPRDGLRVVLLLELHHTLFTPLLRRLQPLRVRLRLLRVLRQPRLLRPRPVLLLVLQPLLLQVRRDLRVVRRHVLLHLLQALRELLRRRRVALLRHHPVVDRLHLLAELLDRRLRHPRVDCDAGQRQDVRLQRVPSLDTLVVHRLLRLDRTLLLEDALKVLCRVRLALRQRVQLEVQVVHAVHLLVHRRRRRRRRRLALDRLRHGRAPQRDERATLRHRLHGVQVHAKSLVAALADRLDVVVHRGRPPAAADRLHLRDVRGRQAGGLQRLLQGGGDAFAEGGGEGDDVVLRRVVLEVVRVGERLDLHLVLRRRRQHLLRLRALLADAREGLLLRARREVAHLVLRVAEHLLHQRVVDAARPLVAGALTEHAEAFLRDVGDGDGVVAVPDVHDRHRLRLLERLRQRLEAEAAVARRRRRAVGGHDDLVLLEADEAQRRLDEAARARRALRHGHDDLRGQRAGRTVLLAAAVAKHRAEQHRRDVHQVEVAARRRQLLAGQLVQQAELLARLALEVQAQQVGGPLGAAGHLCGGLLADVALLLVEGDDGGRRLEGEVVAHDGRHALVVRHHGHARVECAEVNAHDGIVEAHCSVWVLLLVPMKYRYC
eukprot:Rhum_TRINITY_DN14813_c12_g1::Rhum_TRINITY_DN14813_c12_g1_i1::g.120646::m.120646